MMFSTSKYTKWYYQIIKNAKNQNRVKESGFAIHHIIPRSLKGSDDKSNLVILTNREHYVCHLLLVKMTSGINRSKMVFAFFRFRPKEHDIKSSKGFERFTKTFSDYFRGKNNPFYGRKHTPESLKKITGKNHGMFGKKLVDVWTEKYGLEEATKRQQKRCEKLSNSLKGENNPCFGKARTQEQKDYHRKLMTGSGNPNFGKQTNSIYRIRYVSRTRVEKRILFQEITSYL